MSEFDDLRRDVAQLRRASDHAALVVQREQILERTITRDELRTARRDGRFVDFIPKVANGEVRLRTAQEQELLDAINNQLAENPA